MNAIFVNNEFIFNDYNDNGLLNTYCFIVNIDTTTFNWNNNKLMNAVDSDILMNNNLILSQFGNKLKYDIHLDQLTNAYFDNIQFLNNMILTNSLIINHTGSFLNIETHSNGVYFTLLVNVNFTNSFTSDSFISIQNNNVLNQHIKFENIVFDNNNGTIFDSDTRLPTNIYMQCPSDTETYVNDGIIEFENVLFSNNIVYGSYLFKFKLHRMKLLNIRVANNICNNANCIVSEYSALNILSSSFTSNKATNIFHLYSTQICMHNIIVNNDEADSFIYVSPNNISNDDIIINDVTIESVNLK